MSLPIKSTPVLEGEDARRFMKEIENPSETSQEDYERALKVYEAVKESTKKHKDGWFTCSLRCHKISPNPWIVRFGYEKMSVCSDDFKWSYPLNHV